MLNEPKEVDLKAVNRYLTLRRRAADPSTDTGARNEADTARRTADEMEKEYPGIARKAQVIQKVIDTPRNIVEEVFSGAGNRQAANPKPTDPGFWAGVVGETLRKAATGVADRVVDGVAGELSGAGRFDDVPPGELVVKRHEAGAGQTCVELRFRARDMLSDRYGDDLLDLVEEELLKAAKET